MIGSKKIDEVVGSLAWYYLVMEGKCAKEIVSEYTSKCICTGGYFGMTAVVCSKAECALLRWFIYVYNMVNTLLTKEVLKYIMGEVMICRGGRGSGAGGSSNKNYGEGGGTLTTLVFTDSKNWTVPSNIVDNWVSVRIFGGGGGGHSGNMSHDGYAGGGSGWMNNDVLKLSEGEIINIVIGAGGAGAKCYWTGDPSADSRSDAYSGGTTSFGGYLSANGGSAGKTGGIGGAGGAGGGGGDIGLGGRGYQFGGGAPGGDGGVWGGGGGGLQKGGNGGIYGGGGGCYWGNSLGTGGTYGGGSGVNGTNTLGWTNVEKDSTGGYITGEGMCRGPGRYEYGGGGFGGNGGYGRGGGGGGYGGNGGDLDIINIPNGDVCGGGGGGYGKNAIGGKGYSCWNKYSWGASASGGGGGYYCAGKGYGSERYAYGGGGAIINGVEYSSGGNGCWVNSYSSGGWKNGTDGIKGVCVIQFYRDL